MKRMLPSSTTKVAKVNGRTNNPSAGTTVDYDNHDASQLSANGWFDVCGNDSVGTGTTAQRPTTGLVVTSKYLDSTLGYIIVFDGANWRNPATGAAV